MLRVIHHWRVEMDAVQVAIWPCGTWCALEEARDLRELQAHMSDDYKVVDVYEWDEDGSPAAKYFA